MSSILHCDLLCQNDKAKLKYFVNEVNQLKPRILIIIPAYNEAENIERVVNNLTENYSEYDYVIINDGSKDETSKICKKNNYNLIDLPVNLGLSGGFQAGMRYAYLNGYDYAVQIDGDGQHNPAYIEKLYNEIQNKNLDFVIGSRFVTEIKPKTLRMFGSNMISLFLKITTGKTFRDPTSGMRMYNKKLIGIMANSPDFGPEPDTLAYLVRSGASFSEIQVSMNDRLAGESYLNATWSMKYMAYMSSSIILMQWFRKKIKLQEM